MAVYLNAAYKKRTRAQIEASIRGNAGPVKDLIAVAVRYTKHPTGVGEVVERVSAVIAIALQSTNVRLMLEARIESFTQALIDHFPKSPQQLNEKCAAVVQARISTARVYQEGLATAISAAIQEHPGKTYLARQWLEYRMIGNVLERALHTAWRQEVTHVDLTSLRVPSPDTVNAVIGDEVQGETLYYISGYVHNRRNGRNA